MVIGNAEDNGTITLSSPRLHLAIRDSKPLLRRLCFFAHLLLLARQAALCRNRRRGTARFFAGIERSFAYHIVSTTVH
jgi:hypothetical protein